MSKLVVRKLPLALYLLLILLSLVQFIPQPVSAQSGLNAYTPISPSNDYPFDSSARFMSPNKTNPLYLTVNNQYINPSVTPYEVFSSDASIVSVNTSSNPYTYSTHSIYGDAIITAKYAGETYSVTVKVRERTRFTGPWSTTGLQSLPPIFPGLTTSITAGDFTTLTNSPIANAEITFYTADKRSGGRPICTVTTGESGDTTCSLLVAEWYEPFYCAYFEGGPVYQANFSCSQE